jgi:hypothetical protein
MLPALQQKLELGEDQIVSPDAGLMLEGSQKTVLQGTGTPYLNEDDQSQSQQDAGETIEESCPASAFK